MLVGKIILDTYVKELAEAYCSKDLSLYKSVCIKIINMHSRVDISSFSFFKEENSFEKRMISQDLIKILCLIFASLFVLYSAYSVHFPMLYFLK